MESHGFPKITHQIWMQGWNKLPEKFHSNVDTLHELNPNYQHLQWNEQSLRKECQMYSSECLRKFDSFKHMISKVDFGRYVVLYTYGGISIDTDMKPLKPLDSLSELESLQKDFIISSSAIPITPMVNNGIIICKPKCHILKEIIDTICKDTKTEKDFLCKEIFIHKTTGPLFIANIIEKYKDDVQVLDNKYFEPCLSADPYCSIKKESILDHQHELSWFTGIGKSLLKIFCAFFFFVLYYFIYIIILFGIVLLFTNRKEVNHFLRS